TRIKVRSVPELANQGLYLREIIENSEKIKMPQNSSLAPHPSKQHKDWEKALHGGDAALLEHLASSDEPAAALLELETYINGVYRASQHPAFSKPMPDIRFEVRSVLPYVEE